ncbi:hypothetical protein [Streptomyces roseolilacinus]|uniref:hypothetical protein n=1 Tax=Streptomyces roseolilacinus TaxID=66904 RepID=UPI00381BFDEF
MRRFTLTAAAAAILLLVGGCTDKSEDSRLEKPSPTNTPAPTEHTPTTTPPSLDLPNGARILVPETAGNGDLDLPEFTPDEGVYTVFASCVGKGKVKIVDRDDVGNPHPVACDGVRTVGAIHTEKKPQRLKVQVTEGTSDWQIAVVSGDRQP